jgi:hypothetical protein
MTLSRHSAPGTNAAFSYQFERSLYWLTQSPAGSVIGVETGDDVAVHGENASRLLEQDNTPFAAAWTHSVTAPRICGTPWLSG